MYSIKDGKIYERHDDVGVLANVLYAKSDDSTVYTDRECEKPLATTEELKDMFFKGLIVCYMYNDTEMFEHITRMSGDCVSTYAGNMVAADGELPIDEPPIGE